MVQYSSVNKLEIEKFTQHANDWWNIDGKFKILHQINPVRVHYITSKIEQHFDIANHPKLLAKLKIIDIGCGGGLVTSELHKLGMQVTGIDAGFENIAAAKKHAIQHNLNINYLHATVEDILPTSFETYDVVICLELLEHVNNPAEFIKNISYILKPGGMLILSTINRNLKSCLLTIIAAEYILKWIPKKTHDYRKFLKPSEINKFLTKNGMHLQELMGMKFDISTQGWSLCNDIHANYFVYATKSA